MNPIAYIRISASEAPNNAAMALRLAELLEAKTIDPDAGVYFDPFGNVLVGMKQPLSGDAFEGTVREFIEDWIEQPTEADRKRFDLDSFLDKFIRNASIPELQQIARMAFKHVDPDVWQDYFEDEIEEAILQMTRYGD